MNDTTTRTPSAWDRGALWGTILIGVVAAGWTLVTAVLRIIEIAPNRDVPVPASFADTETGLAVGDDGGTITVHGCAERLHAPAAPLHGHNDHRVVMSLAVLAAAAGLPLTVDDAEAIQKSWPGFFADAAPLGVEVEDA